MAKIVKKTKAKVVKKAVAAKKSAPAKAKTSSKGKTASAAKKTVKAKSAPKKNVVVKAKPVAKKSAPAKKKAISKTKTPVKAKTAPKAKIQAKPIKKAAPKTAKTTSKTPVVKTPAKKAIKELKVSKTVLKQEAKPSKEVIKSAKEAPKQERIIRPAKDLPKKKSILRSAVADEVSFDMPAPKKNQHVVLSNEEKLKIKKTLLAKCIEIQKSNVVRAKKAMEEAQESANAEKGTSEDMSDSFRETMQATRDMYARQVHEGTNTLALLNRIMVQEHEWVKFGSVVITDYQNYFISSGLGEIKINDQGFITVSTLSPLFQILASKRKGEQFMFLDRMYRVIDVF